MGSVHIPGIIIEDVSRFGKIVILLKCLLVLLEKGIPVINRLLEQSLEPLLVLF